MLDPGPDMGKTPFQTIEVLRQFDALHDFGRPLLLAVSRKDFVGALTARSPRERLAGTLAAIGFGVEAGAHVLRVHDVAAAAEFLTVHGGPAGRARGATRRCTLPSRCAGTSRTEAGAPASVRAQRIAGRWLNATGAHRIHPKRGGDPCPSWTARA